MGWEGQLSQLADLLETDPEAGMQSLRGFMLPDDRNPEFPDPIPHESAVLADAIVYADQQRLIFAEKRLSQAARSHGVESRAYAAAKAERDALAEPPRRLSDEERERLADEIEMDML